MRRNSIKIIMVALAMTLLLSGCINPTQEEQTTTKPPINVDNVKPNAIGSYKTMAYQYHTNVDVSTLTTNLDQSYLILANKTNDLSSDYVPDALVTLTCSKLESDRAYELNSRAATALYAMLAEMAADGVGDIMVASAYRSYEDQAAAFHRHVEKEKSTLTNDAYHVLGEDYIRMNYLEKGIYRLTTEDAETVVQSYSALPGQSEHQTGLCVDFATSEEGEVLTESFEHTEAFAWLSQNAYKFGFILRYPKGQEDVTGYTYEPWHYRFVGREVATDIWVGNMTLEQYLYLANVQ